LAAPSHTVADAIVVFGCTLDAAGNPSTALTRRLELAHRCWAAGCAPWLVVSGGRRWGQFVEATVMRRELLALGVPASVVSVEAASLTTRDNCRFVAPMLRARGGERVMVATCAWHLPRAMAGLVRTGLTPVAPPSAWLHTPNPSLASKLRESLSSLTDAAVARFATRSAS
jgi:uncharacterized SAM-binding protein YcdF (DUF218 family)